MAFRAIGDLAVTVLAKAKLQAAAHEAPRKGGSEPSTRGRERPDPLPRLNADGSASNVNVVARKEASAETPAQLCPAGGVTGALGVVRVKQVRRTTLDTPLTMSRERYVATHAPRGRRPNGPAAYLSLVVDNTHASTDFLRGTL
jgi:hypothetical protein